MAQTPSNEPTDYSQPVAYDTNGRPLYAHPPQQENQANEQHPPVVYMTRPAEPMEQHISEAAQKRHEESKQKFPALNLSDGEYVISEVNRHPIGLFSIWFIVAVILGTVFIGGPILMAIVAPGFTSTLQPDAITNGILFLIFLAAFFIIGGIVATVIYLGNRFSLTNESVIQRIQHDSVARARLGRRLPVLDELTARRIEAEVGAAGLGELDGVRGHVARAADRGDRVGVHPPAHEEVGHGLDDAEVPALDPLPECRHAAWPNGSLMALGVSP